MVAEPLPAQLSPGVPEGTGRAVWLVPFHRAEVALAGGLRRLLEAPVDRLAGFQAVDWTVALGWLRQSTGIGPGTRAGGGGRGWPSPSGWRC